MSVSPEKLQRIVHRQAADLSIKGLLIAALAQQVPDIDKLILDFSEMAEDHAVRTMNSSMPEEFFQEVQTLRKVWLVMLRDIAASK